MAYVRTQFAGGAGIFTVRQDAKQLTCSSVWTGTRMIVWGGYNRNVSPFYFNTGGRYDPATDTWTATSLIGAPPGRENHTAVWTGTHMNIWSGYGHGYFRRSGGRYTP